MTKPTPNPQTLDNSLLSAVRGRQRWKVPAIHRRPLLARALEETLAANQCVMVIKTNPVTGSLLVVFDPRLEIDVRSWIEKGLDDARAALAQAVAAPSTSSRGSRRQLMGILKGSLPPNKMLWLPPLLSITSKAVDIGQGLGFVATVNTARGDGPAFLAKLGLRQPGARLAFMGLLSLSLVVANTVLQPLRKKAWTGVAEATEQQLRTRLFAHIVGQDLEFFDQHGTSQLKQVIADDTAKIGDFVGEAIDRLLQKAVVLAISGTGLLFASPLLFFFVCLPIPLFLTPSSLLGPKIKKAYRQLGKSNDQLQHHLEDSLAGIADVKAFTAETSEIMRFRKAGMNVARDTVATETVETLADELTDGLVHLGLYSAATYAGSLAASGQIPQNTYTSALFLIPRLLSVPADFDGITGRYYKAVEASERIATFLDSKPKIHSGPKRLTRTQGQIVFENVDFAYGLAPATLSGVTFCLEAGKTLAIVGPTGSGKSTLLRLLLRFYDPTGGRILLDGQDLCELEIADLRQKISLVNQDVYLFSGTLRDNVRFGHPGASDQQIVEALTKASALDVLESRAQGLDADVGPRGRKLSGGERQRVAIARALLKKSPILALDEATSSLDYATEAAIQHYLREETENRSVIVVAHRLASIRHADHIVVLESGRIREQGRHTKLVRSGGLYASLWKLQSGESPYGAEIELRLSRPSSGT